MQDIKNILLAFLQSAFSQFNKLPHDYRSLSYVLLSWFRYTQVLTTTIKWSSADSWIMHARAQKMENSFERFICKISIKHLMLVGLLLYPKDTSRAD